MKKVLTILEPYVSPIAQGKKHFETRSWPTNYRGTIYIHTGKKTMPDPVDGLEKIFPLGCIVIKAELTDCIPMDEKFISEIKKDEMEYKLGFYSVGRYAWKLENIEVIKPIPAKGKLGIWTYREEKQMRKWALTCNTAAPEDEYTTAHNLVLDIAPEIG